MQRKLRLSAAAEVTALAVLILSYIWVWQRSFPGSFLVVIAGYFGIGILGHLSRGESLAHIGVRWDNWRPALRNAAIVAAIAMSLALITGTLMDSWHFPHWSRAAPSILVTIIWGTAQQYGLLCVFFRRLYDVFGSAAVAAFGASASFALFHLPNSFLMGVTLVAGCVACALYRKEPNLFALGIAHAFISFTLYHALPFEVTAGLHVGPGYFTFMQKIALMTP